MKEQKIFNIPYSVKDLQIKVILFEKIKPKSEGLNFCCWINGVPVYTDSSMERAKVLTGSNTDSHKVKDNVTKFLIVGYEPEEIKTDSTILQCLTVLIAEVYK